MDLVEEFRRNPFGPHGPELTLLVNQLRIIPMEQRYIIVCTRRAREWAVAKMPTIRGAPVELVVGATFDDFAAAVREVFRLRWQAVTGLVLDP
jgi:hypothetical protein